MPDPRFRDEVTSPLCDADPLARALSQLAPLPSGLSRDAIAFAAGEQASAIRVRRWRTGVIGLSVALFSSWTVYFLIGSTVPEQELAGTAPVPHTPAAKSPDRSDGSSAPRSVPPVVALDLPSDDLLESRIRGLKLRNDILTGGLGIVPTPDSIGLPPGYRGPSVGTPPGVLGGHYAAPPRPPLDVLPE